MAIMCPAGDMINQGIKTSFQKRERKTLANWPT